MRLIQHEVQPTHENSCSLAPAILLIDTVEQPAKDQVNREREREGEGGRQKSKGRGDDSLTHRPILSMQTSSCTWP